MSRKKEPSSSQRKPVTAKELMDRLNRDPEWVAKEEARRLKHEELGRELDRNQLPLLEDLGKAGFRLGSVYDLVNSKNSYPEAIATLIRHLDYGVKYHPLIREGIARALTVPEARDHLFKIFEAFRTDPDTSLGGPKWALGNAIEVLADDGYTEEIASLALDESHGAARTMLVVKLGASKKPIARSVLTKLVDDPYIEVSLTAKKMLSENKEVSNQVD